ncbi:MAG: ABC transporter permease [Bifidobacteriaceae bacterium]|nr:ABC transporter permease [Bifidobacteriaceae bacterium]
MINEILCFTKRNLKLYFRDKMAVFFSLLGVLIIIVLYILFLAKMQIDGFVTGSGGSISEADATYFIYAWVLSGVLSVACMTVSLAVQEIVVTDLERKVVYDFKTSPVKTGSYSISAVFSGFTVSVIVTTLIFAGYTAFIRMSTGCMFSFQTIALTLLLIVFNALASSAFIGVLVLSAKSGAAISALTALFSSVFGFVNGSYMPIGALSESVQNVTVAMPFIHSSALFRQVLTADAADKLFAGVPDAIRIENLQMYGVDLQFAGNAIAPAVSVAYIAVFGAVSVAVAVMVSRRKLGDG